MISLNCVHCIKSSSWEIHRILKYDSLVGKALEINTIVSHGFNQIHVLKGLGILSSGITAQDWHWSRLRKILNSGEIIFMLFFNWNTNLAVNIFFFLKRVFKWSSGHMSWVLKTHSERYSLWAVCSFLHSSLHSLHLTASRSKISREHGALNWTSFPDQQPLCLQLQLKSMWSYSCPRDVFMNKSYAMN